MKKIKKKGTCVPTRQAPVVSAEYRGRVPLIPANKNINKKGKKSIIDSNHL